MRDDDTVCREIKATIAFVIVRESKKDTLCRSWCKFMGHGGRNVWVTTASKHTKVIISRWCTKEGLVRSSVLKSFGGV
jgi:hypothetical protein